MNLPSNIIDAFYWDDEKTQPLDADGITDDWNDHESWMSHVHEQLEEESYFRKKYESFIDKYGEDAKEEYERSVYCEQHNGHYFYDQIVLKDENGKTYTYFASDLRKYAKQHGIEL